MRFPWGLFPPELNRMPSILSEPGLLLSLFDLIEEDGTLSQRDMSTKLGISLGNANTLIHKAMDEGFLVNGGNSCYRLTPAGAGEMSRLRYHRMRNTIDWYKTTRSRVVENLRALAGQGVRRVVFYGVDDLADVVFAMMQGLPLKLVAVVDDHHAGEGFNALAVSPESDLLRMDYDRIVVTTFRAAETVRSQARQLGLPESKLFFFH